jgi:hypothetical protein
MNICSFYAVTHSYGVYCVEQGATLFTHDCTQPIAATSSSSQLSDPACDAHLDPGTGCFHAAIPDVWSEILFKVCPSLFDNASPWWTAVVWSEHYPMNSCGLKWTLPNEQLWSEVNFTQVHTRKNNEHKHSELHRSAILNATKTRCTNAVLCRTKLLFIRVVRTVEIGF